MNGPLAICFLVIFFAWIASILFVRKGLAELKESDDREGNFLIRVSAFRNIVAGVAGFILWLLILVFMIKNNLFP